MRNLIIDSQILNTVQNCAFKYNLTFAKNLRPLMKPTYFDEGDLIHEIFASFYRGHMEGLSYRDRRERAIALGWEHSATLDLNIKETTEKIQVANEYFDYQQDKETFKKVLAVEQPFAFLLGESEEDDIRVAYVGKIDLVVQTANNEMRPWDHKTGGKRIAPHMLSNQFIGYCLALGVNLIDINKVAFIKDPDKFRRYTLTYADELIERWVKNTMWWAAQLDFYMQTGTYPQNFTSCDKYGGCEYADICKCVSLEAMEQTATIQYKIAEPWDVSKILADSKKVIPLQLAE